MPKNVMKLLKPSPNYGRNDFDLSHRHLFEANYGELIPGTCIETVPNDKIIIRISDLVRSQPMVTSPFARAKQHVDIWFVPYNLMWSKFNEFIVDKDEPGSSALNDRLYIPHTSLDDLFIALTDYHSGAATDIHGYNSTAAVCRNLDLMGYPGTLLHLATQSQAQYANKSVNLWRLLAYQLIWYREYRQKYYDDGKFGLPSSIANLANGAAYLFNMDWMRCDSLADAKLDSSNATQLGLLDCILQPRYRLWKKDLFTGLLPSTQFGNVSLVSSDLPTGFYIKGANSSMGGYTPVTDSDAYLTSNNGYNWSLVKSPGAKLPEFDVLALRKSEAIQKWRENALRSGNQVQDNFVGHYGVKPSSHMDVHPQHIASISAPLNIGDIAATTNVGSNVENGLVGDIAGKGIMSFDGSEAIKFETNDFGVIMCLYSILPEAEYNANSVDRLNCLLEREDYFFNEYENLGLEAVDKCNISCNTNSTGIVGYAPRYFGYKTKLDKVTGGFQKFQGFNGQYRHWAAPKYDVDGISMLDPVPLSCLYVNPRIFDGNFYYGKAVTDEFLVDFYVECEAIRQMSVSGMPGY